MANIILSAFADEYANSFEEQLQGLSKLGISHIEIRHVNKKNISKLTKIKDNSVSEYINGIHDNLKTLKKIRHHKGAVLAVEAGETIMIDKKELIEYANRHNIAVVAVYAAFMGDTSELMPLALTLCLAVFNGIVGFVDDYCKLVKKKNEGLKAYQKFILQLIAAGSYIYIMIITGRINTALHIPFTDISWELGWTYYIFSIIIITGVVNSVNLTDGIDGLASSVVFVIGAFFAVVAFSLDFLADSAWVETRSSIDLAISSMSTFSSVKIIAAREFG